ncbi:MAG: carboxylating nicotinate-nucleotide diphosphorylase [Candidatus Kapaibacteriales bacterium]
MPFHPYQQIDQIDKTTILSYFKLWLEEDIPTQDLTTEIFYDDNQLSEAYLETEEAIIFAGKQIVDVLPELTSSSIEIKWNFQDGDFLPKKSQIFSIKAPTKFLLKVERTLLNILQRLSGIATNTRQYVEIARPYGVRILDTRKTTPGLRVFEKYAVRCGGGYNHRLNLSQGILIKDNHIISAGSVRKAIENARLKYPTKFIEIEIENISQLTEALAYQVDGILLDNLTPKQVSDYVKIIRELNPLVFIEASGGITLDNLSNYVITGVDAISIGALTHSAKSVKMHLEFVY